MPSAPVSIAEKLKTLPAKAGVYLMKDASGKVIYVGKAASLRHRVQSYFQDGDLAPRVRSMVERVRDFDYLITTSEVEALVLEFTLIQRHRPRYNVRFRDDKRYPYIKITVAEKHPAILTRSPYNKGNLYNFGAFHAAEIRYAFGHDIGANNPFTEIDHRISKNRGTYWIRFAATGNPNGPGLLEWPVYQQETRQRMILDLPLHVETADNVTKCEFWRKRDIKISLANEIFPIAEK